MTTYEDRARVAFWIGAALILGVAVNAVAIKRAMSAERCIASVYSTTDKDQNGTKTASGIPLDDNKPSAAHRTRKLNSRVVLLNRDNGKRLQVPITDRGPFIAGRCFDLSRAAAILLGCKGLCRVEAKR